MASLLALLSHAVLSHHTQQLRVSCRQPHERTFHPQSPILYRSSPPPRHSKPSSGHQHNLQVWTQYLLKSFKSSHRNYQASRMRFSNNKSASETVQGALHMPGASALLLTLQREENLPSQLQFSDSHTPGFSTSWNQQPSERSRHLSNSAARCQSNEQYQYERQLRQRRQRKATISRPLAGDYETSRSAHVPGQRECRIRVRQLVLYLRRARMRPMKAAAAAAVPNSINLERPSFPGGCSSALRLIS